MSCSKCEHMTLEMRINSPRQFRRVIAGVQAEMNECTLEETSQRHREEFIQQPAFSELSVKGPWPDVLSYQFRCTACGQRFSLTVETYHGSGGWWKPVPEPVAGSNGEQ